MHFCTLRHIFQMQFKTMNYEQESRYSQNAKITNKKIKFEDLVQKKIIKSFRSYDIMLTIFFFQSHLCHNR